MYMYMYIYILKSLVTLERENCKIDEMHVSQENT